MLPEDCLEATLDFLCAAVAADTGIPTGRVKKVLLSAQRQQQAGNPSAPPASLAPQADPLRFHPLGANGRIHPPIQQSRIGHADNPA
jgi:hypothetical protein